MNLKDYFKILSEIKKLKEYSLLVKEKDLFKYLKINRKIRDLEYKIIDISISIKYNLTEEEQQYMYFKYKEKLSNKAMINIFSKSESTLNRIQNNILNKLRLR